MFLTTKVTKFFNVYVDDKICEIVQLRRHKFGNLRFFDDLII